MRTPWYIYTPLSIIVTLLTLYICIKDKDTVTPPTHQETAQDVASWKKNNPILKNTTPLKKQKIKPTPQTPKPITPKPTPPSPPKTIAKIKIPEIAPALNSLTKQKLNTKQLTHYALQMQKNGKPQLARIAHERIIDSASDATPEHKKQAASAIISLISQTPLWNPDPTTRKKITININTHKQHTPTIKQLIPKLENLIFNASDGTLNPTITIKSTTNLTANLNLGTPNSNIAFQINTTPETAIHTAIYKAIRKKHSLTSSTTHTPTLPKHITPKQALQSYITRLTWRIAAQ